MVRKVFKLTTDIILRKEKRAGVEREGGMSQKYSKQDTFAGNENKNSTADSSLTGTQATGKNFVLAEIWLAA